MSVFCSFQCQKPFTADDVVILNASDEDLTRMSDRLETRQARLKAEKKDKKLKLKEGMGDASTSQNGKKPVATTSHPNDPKDAKSDQGSDRSLLHLGEAYHRS